MSKSKAFVDIIWSSSDLRDSSNLLDLLCTNNLHSQMVYISKLVASNRMRFVQKRRQPRICPASLSSLLSQSLRYLKHVSQNLNVALVWFVLASARNDNVSSS
jgi:hypothetical protein